MSCGGGLRRGGDYGFTGCVERSRALLDDMESRREEKRHSTLTGAPPHGAVGLLVRNVQLTDCEETLSPPLHVMRAPRVLGARGTVPDILVEVILKEDRQDETPTQINPLGPPASVVAVPILVVVRLLRGDGKGTFSCIPFRFAAQIRLC
jgi:hypothetical protein